MFEQARDISEFLLMWLDREWLTPPHQKVLLTYYGSYKRHFPPRLQHYYRRQTEEVMSLIRAQPGARVLEIGSGTGTESLWMAMQGASVQAVELTRDRFEVANARKAILEADLGRHIECEFTNGSLLDMTPIESFDVVWMEQAFHHLEPRQEVVDRVLMLLKPGGHVVISEANSLNVLLQAQVIRGRGFKTVKYFEDHLGRRHPYGDERILSGGTLSRLFAKRGVHIVSLQYFRLFPNHPAFDRLLWLEQLTPQWLRPLFTHYNYVGRKTA
jgi:SAM-dependent methyltransferase